MKRLFTDEQEAAIVAAYVGGESSPSIGGKCGTSKTVIQNILRRHNIERRTLNALTAAGEAGVIAAYHADELVPSIAARFGVHVATVKKILRRHKVPHRGCRKTYAIDHDVFAEVTDERRAYLLGLIATDGSVGDRMLTITLQARDKVYLESIRDAIGCNVIVRDRVAKIGGREYPCASLVIYSRKIVADLARHGIHPNKTHTLRWWDGPPPLMPHYIRGLIDGDGSVKHRMGGGVVSFCGNPHMTAALAAYFASTLGVIHSTHENRGAAWVLTYSRLLSMQPLLSHIYGGASYYLGRKKATADAIVIATPGPRCRPPITTPAKL